MPRVLRYFVLLLTMLAIGTGAVVRAGAQTVALPAPGTPPPADIVVGSALRTAQAQQKTVLIEFGASWCVWCRSFEAFVKAPDTRSIIAANYVVVNLVVHERDEKQVLENPGGQVRMNQWGGATSGLPFYVFLNEKGDKIADSNAMPDGGNIGFPAVPAEVSAFMGLIDHTARHLTAKQRNVLEAYLLRVMPPPSSH